MIASGYVFTSRTEGTIDGSDMDGSTRQTQCITTTPQTDNHALDVGFYIPATPEAPVDNGNGNDNTNSGSGGTVTPPSDYRYNKCLYTTTTDESTNTYANTNHESIHPTDSGHYNNDCNNTDPSYTKTYGQTTHDERSTAIEMNAQGETFFHLNLHGSEDVVKHNIALYDRIPDSLTISGVSIYTTTSGSMTQADTTPRAAVYCHSSSTMPSIDHSILTGVALPDASAIGT